ncbi:MAG: hypothetical protein U0903_13215 [Planctomycetales bacterium]
MPTSGATGLDAAFAGRRQLPGYNDPRGAHARSSAKPMASPVSLSIVTPTGSSLQFTSRPRCPSGHPRQSVGRKLKPKRDLAPHRKRESAKPKPLDLQDGLLRGPQPPRPSSLRSSIRYGPHISQPEGQKTASSGSA